jgi:hypothetical protein
MSNIFSLTGSTHGDARRAKLDVVTAAMLNGGASGGWLMTRALKSRASLCLHAGRAEAAASLRMPSSDASDEHRRNPRPYPV